MEEIALSSLKCLALYVAIIISLRFLGKKTVAEISSIDLVFMILIGSTLGQQMPENKFLGSLAAIATLSLANYLISYLATKFPKFKKLIEDVPVILVKRGKIKKDKLKEELITTEDLKQAMRDKGIENIDEIKEAVLETTGKINILKEKQKRK